MSWLDCMVEAARGERERYLAYLYMGIDGDDAAVMAAEDMEERALALFIAEQPAHNAPAEAARP
jgi:hypothetical protein